MGTLNEKIIEDGEVCEVFNKSDVEDFIEKLKDECFIFNWDMKLTEREGYIYLCKKIDELSGFTSVSNNKKTIHTKTKTWRIKNLIYRLLEK